ncbi:MAG: hypothetical protein CMJ25_08540 [Phycisphaerae bacterium]|nr:hypothetical protein [Phycisphaerae bacterium]
MKIIANLLIAISLIAGSLASSTAYLVRIDGANPEKLSTLRLGSPAGSFDPSFASPEFNDRLEKVRAGLGAGGAAETNPLKPETTPRVPAEVPAVQTAPTGESVLRARESIMPIGQAGDPLTPGLIALLDESDVTYVKVTEFSIARWPYAWLFGVSCLGLLAGALMMRNARKAELAQADSASASDVAQATDAQTVFARLSGRLHSLTEDLARTHDTSTRLEAILLHIGKIQRDDVPAFVANEPALVNRLSLAGYAELMDSFAAMERQLNRAWSAAADAHLPESEQCLRDAQPLLVETLRRLKVSS